MKIINLVVALFCFSALANAQQKKKSPVKRMLFHSHGISFQKFDNLNNRIANYPQFQSSKNSTGTFQFGSFTERDRLITGLSLNVGSSLNGNRNKKSTTINFFGFAADIGYNFLKGTQVSLYPFAGLGYEKYKVRFNRDISTIPFDSVLQSVNFQQRTENLAFTNSFFVYRAGMGVNITSKKHLQNSVGLQVGYTGGFGEQEWKINKSQTLSNSPKDKLSKIFISIIIRYQLKHKN